MEYVQQQKFPRYERLLQLRRLNAIAELYYSISHLFNACIEINNNVNGGHKDFCCDEDNHYNILVGEGDSMGPHVPIHSRYSP
jgi:hypothetical protein